MTPDQDRFLREHRTAVLATGRRDGSPQISTMGYAYDGKHVVMSVTSDRAKWHNAGRQPKVAMVVNEGHKQLVLYGTAKRIADDPDRLALTKQLRTAIGREPLGDDATLARELNDAKRVIMLITPDKVRMNE